MHKSILTYYNIYHETLKEINNTPKNCDIQLVILNTIVYTTAEKKIPNKAECPADTRDAEYYNYSWGYGTSIVPCCDVSYVCKNYSSFIKSER